MNLSKAFAWGLVIMLVALLSSLGDMSPGLWLWESSTSWEVVEAKVSKYSMLAAFLHGTFATIIATLLLFKLDWKKVNNFQTFQNNGSSMPSRKDWAIFKNCTNLNSYSSLPHTSPKVQKGHPLSHHMTK